MRFTARHRSLSRDGDKLSGSVNWTSRKLKSRSESSAVPGPKVTRLHLEVSPSVTSRSLIQPPLRWSKRFCGSRALIDISSVTRYHAPRTSLICSASERFLEVYGDFECGWKEDGICSCTASISGSRLVDNVLETVPIALFPKFFSDGS